MSYFESCIVENLHIVSLKTTLERAEKVEGLLSLADAVGFKRGAVCSLWTSPGCWLLVSDSNSPAEMVASCSSKLGDIPHLAVDYSDGLSVFRINGSGLRSVMSAGCALDFRESRFQVNKAYRTRFANIAVIVVTVAEDCFELLADSSYESYLSDWLDKSAAISERASL